MKIRTLDLSSHEDFAHYSRGLSALYSELFGESAVVPPAQLARIRESSLKTTVANWAFGGFDEGERESELRAFFTLSESFAAFAGGGYLILGELWVHPQLRSNGAGQRIIAFCGEWATGKGYGRIDVSAPTDEKWLRTVNFYRTRGFIETGKKFKLLLPQSPNAE